MVTPLSGSLNLGGTQVLSAVAFGAGGQPVTVTFTWQSSNQGIATVDAGGKVTAVGVGVANITASSGTVQSPPVPMTVTPAEDTNWPTTGTTSSSDLIEAARQSGGLSSEQALTYEVFAAFRDSRLPVLYRGIPDQRIENPVLMIAAERYPSLSPATQAILAPFFIDPGYEGSWYAARFGSAGASAAVHPAAGTTGARLTSAECLARLDFDGWKTKSTAHFRVHYQYHSLFGPQAVQLTAATADIVVAEIESIWLKETTTFGRLPLSDATQSDNGCDGAVDIWVYDFANWDLNHIPLGIRDVSAKTVPYLGGACKTASRIHLQGIPDARKIRNQLAHEFFHVLELGSYTRAQCLGEYFWLGEATANWAMDLAYPDDEYEHSYAADYAYYERLVPIDEFGAGGKNCQGYCDYPFLLYLARKYDDALIRAIWDASESGNSVEAIVQALVSKGGIKSVWPEFALAMWNDFGADYQRDFHRWDDLEWGMKKAFDTKDAGGRYGEPSEKIDLRGTQRKTFEGLRSAPTTAAGRELPRLSIHADYYKFTDPAVASVLYLNPMALANFPDLKIQALIKQAGVWKPAEDWTREGYKGYCRDLRAERIEELVLIYSNSDGRRPSAPIQLFSGPRVSVSNVGCAEWSGTASVETAVPGQFGGQSTANVSNFVLKREPGPDSPGFQAFMNVSGAVTGSASGFCSTSAAQGAAIALDARLLINLDILDAGALGSPPDRDILQGIGSTMLSTTTTFCGITSVGNQYWSWFEIPVPGYTVHSNGRTIEGNVVLTAPTGAPEFTKTLKWNLTAVREP